VKAHHGLWKVLDKLSQSRAFQNLEHCVFYFLLIIHVIALMSTELIFCHHLQEHRVMAGWFKQTQSSLEFFYKSNSKALNLRPMPTWPEVTIWSGTPSGQISPPIRRSICIPKSNWLGWFAPYLYLHVKVSLLPLFSLLGFHPLLLLQPLHQLLGDIIVCDRLQDLTWTWQQHYKYRWTEDKHMP